MPREAMGDPEAMAQYRQEGGATVTASADSAAVQRSSSAPASGASDDAQAAVQQVLEKSGNPIDPDLTTQLNERMDADFWDVRVHTGSEAAAACDAIDARAFTCGSDIVFNSGEYEPDSPEGQYLLAHELAHVKQQNGGAEVSMMPQADAELEIDPDPRLEREADDAAANALEDGPVVVNRKGIETHIQRMPDTDQLQNARKQAASRNDEMTLAQTVEQLEDRVASIEEIVNDDGSVMNNVGKAISQGAIGAVGGLIGAVAGTGISPGLGTLGGAAVGQEMAKGVAGDVTKTLTGKAYDKGTDFVAEKGNQARDFLEQLIEDKVDDLLDESEHRGNTKFKG
ncbi:transposase [Natrinema ejinorense]|uniref:Transposase n=1 Tax=Natrinema ejinorense TaxID=373386 RepID=A0A2A5R110_9EURY|nr:transposase [Natrinema ejinorense]